MKIPVCILKLIPPPAFGYGRDRETFDRYSSISFDPVAAAEGSANHTLSFLLDTDRLTRIIHHHARDSKQISLGDYLSDIGDAVFGMDGENGMQEEIAQSTQRMYVGHLLKIFRDKSAFGKVQAEAFAELQRIQLKHLISLSPNSRYILKMIGDGLDTSKELKLPAMPDMPPGSPIGCE